jgi:inner membrane protein
VRRVGPRWEATRAPTKAAIRRGKASSSPLTFYLKTGVTDDIFLDMPTFVGHSLVALSVCAPLHRTPLGKVMSFPDWLALLVIASLLPDLDVLMLRWFPYSHPLSHRGLAHSLPFALVAAFCITMSCNLAGILPGTLFTFILVWLLVASVMGSHGLLDALTDGGLGIGLFIPLTLRRYFFPITPIPVALLEPATMFSPYMWHVYAVEVALFTPFCLAAWLSGADLSGMPIFSAFRWLAATALVIGGVAIWIARCRSVRE